jgi:hypothetical protein
MLRPKTLWHLAIRSEVDSRSPWVSASRDTEEYAAAYKAWLAALPVNSTAPCYLITGPHNTQVTTWGDALHWLLHAPLGSEDYFVLHSDLQTVLTIHYIGVARFTPKSVPEKMPRPCGDP